LAQVPALIGAVGAKHHLIIEIVETHVSLTHKNRDVIRAAGCMARIHRELASGGDLREAILAEGSDYISKKKISKWQERPDSEVVGKILSPACYIQDAFPAALYLAWKYAGDFSGGIIANANVGGDNCHRGAVVGSLLGVAAGVPKKWLEGLVALNR
jgi:ADP-ribosylglycohydrolase